MEDIWQVQQEVILGEDGGKEGKNLKHHSPCSMKWQIVPKKVAGRKKGFSLVEGTLGVAFCFAVLFRERKTREEDELG